MKFFSYIILLTYSCFFSFLIFLSVPLLNYHYYKKNKEHNVLDFRFDGYAVVEINGKTYRIAFEYDGSYHDDIEHFYYTYYDRDFYKVVARDTVKSQEANNHETIIIRLKESIGFDIHTIHLFQQEIIRQFEELTSEKLSINHIYTFDFRINKLIKAKQIDNFIGNK